MEWILQTLMMMGAKAASIFLHPDSPNFEVVQGMMAILAGMMLGAKAASIFLHPDSPNFEVVQGMMAILALVGLVLLITFAFRKK